ncbi:beta-ketoacyl synthase N-terminal-like domain-containing protein [Streptomyces sp. 6N223]|uniref:beta-ketoacyl synthase N-terminal-like domain-containing protein n=1 Tax=Streptomyces sp. 6N223 TaxID=3457412 RepID=UPI003FCEF542
MTDLVVSAWSAVSAYGVGNEPFRDGITAGRSAVAPLDPDAHPGPFASGGVVPDFSARTHVGKKGTRTMDRVTAIAVTAVGRLIADCQDELAERPDQMGLVLGTGSGSVQSIMDFTKGSLTGERPYHVEAARFPNTVMNRAAGQSAIWHGIKGPNTTVAGGALTGLLALSYAVRLHRGGHCTRVMCGAAEEFTTQRALLEWHGRDADHTAEAPLGEGSAVFLMETAEQAAAGGRRPLARVLTTRFCGFHDPGGAREALADCVREALNAAHVRPSDVRLVAPGLGGGRRLAEQEEAAIGEALGLPDPADPERIEWVRIGPLVGDASAAATSLQLAAVLATAGEEGLAPGEVALVTGVERDGMVGCAVLGGDWPWPPPPAVPTTEEE